MKKQLIILLALVILVPEVFSAAEPFISFDDLKCDDLGVLSFRAGYEWNSFNGGYAELQNIKVGAMLRGVTEKLTGYWYKFEDKSFTISSISLKSPKSYYFSKPGSLKEGRYKVSIDYIISRNNVQYFKNTFTASVSCPVQREVVKPVEKVEIVEESVKEVEEPVPKIVGEPPLIDMNSKSYTIYYMIGLWIILFIISSFVSKKFYKKRPKAKKKSDSENEESVVEKVV